MRSVFHFLIVSLVACGGFAADVSPRKKEEGPKIEVTVTSDFQTWVSIPGLKAPQKFWEMKVLLPPGDYEVVGRRKEFEEVKKPLKIRPGDKPMEIHVACTVRAG